MLYKDVAPRPISENGVYSLVMLLQSRKKMVCRILFCRPIPGYRVFSNTPCKYKLWGVNGLKKHTKFVENKLGRPKNIYRLVKQFMINLSITFIDTFRFMSESLNSLSEDKTRFREKLKIFSLSTLNLVTRKGVFSKFFPIKLNETCLPLKQSFYNSLKDEEIMIIKDYVHAH
ncbi:hypothetical protein QTP88_007741 [Uroleucon formosanum]